ncbi:cell division protein FtsQ/DivIB [Cohnella nanjingensis]|uniref:FtsQ-type POTRA domain-containing protein n=1 Tax=Cohnella nanjingensis TaxID=1387779 RepID=A0A7X0RVF7_9BACL|nr:FtsQ-type POTRA domain-containing protein [Cohnella nanjingensis]MBB6673216.1 FtsQ-type POTRA domain-containing protein [Cohnella nanjingensis]
MTERIPAIKREPAERRRGGKLLWIVIALFVIVLVVLFFRSSLSRITDIEVTGNAYATRAEIEQALGVQAGDSFFSPSAKTLERRVEQLQSVHLAQAKKRFPGKLTIEVQEYAPVAVELDGSGKLGLVLENGLVLPAKEGTALPNKPVLAGWKADDPQRLALCQVLGKIQEGQLSDLSQISPDPSKAYPDRIKLYTRSRFEVITTVGKLGEKIPILNELVENREPGQVVMLDSDTYRPYSAQNAS